MGIELGFVKSKFIDQKYQSLIDLLVYLKIYFIEIYINKQFN